MVRRETLIRFGLGAVAVVATATGTIWLTQPAAPKPQVADTYPIEDLKAGSGYEPVQLAFDLQPPRQPQSLELTTAGNNEKPPWFEASEHQPQLQAFPPVDDSLGLPAEELQPMPEFEAPQQNDSNEYPEEEKSEVVSVLLNDPTTGADLTEEKTDFAPPSNSDFNPPANNDFVVDEKEDEIEFGGPLPDPFLELDAANDARQNAPPQSTPQQIAQSAIERQSPQRTFNQPPPIAAPVDMRQVNIRAKQLIDDGVARFERRMLAAAKVKFIRSIRIVSQSLDAQRPGNRHSVALAQGIRAMEEAKDFAASSSSLEGDVDIAMIIASHRTPILKDYGQGLQQITPMIAIQRYFQFAQQRLADACGNQPIASRALFAWGKVEIAENKKTGGDHPLNEPKAMALYQASLMVDARNQRAANELGVSLARYGQLADARDVLVHSVLTSPTPASWQNLAAVHQRLGEHELAKRARYEGELLARRTPAMPSADMSVQWVSPHEFATGQPAPQTTQVVSPQPVVKQATPWWAPWRR